MTQPAPSWWQLHLRKARGESLSQAELQAYEAELARQDKEAPRLNTDVATLIDLRTQISHLAQLNGDYRSRLAELEAEVQHLEQALAQPAREALGLKG
jgi:chromosome segregation ATPase